MAGKIFISYRRGDEPGVTQALYGQLEKSFGKGNLFFDVNDIAPGQDFVTVIEKQIAASDIVLVIIGKGWVKVSDDQGRRRLDNPNDFVRVEVEQGLTQGKHVVPVLVYGATMPTEADLPQSLHALARRTAVKVTHESFAREASELMAALSSALKDIKRERDQKRQQEQRERRAAMPRGQGVSKARLALGAAVAVVALAGVAYATNLLGLGGSSPSYDQTSYPADTSYTPSSDLNYQQPVDPSYQIPLIDENGNDVPTMQPASDPTYIQPIPDNSSTWTDPATSAAPAWQDPNPSANQLEINPFEPPVSTDGQVVN